MRYRIKHITRYDYTSDVSLCHNRAVLTPRDHAHQFCHETELRITPQPAVVHQRTDFFGNRATFFAVQSFHQHLEVQCVSQVEVSKRRYPDPAQTLQWEAVREAVRSDLRRPMLEAFEMTFDSLEVPTSDALAEYARPSFTPRRPMLEAVYDLNHRINTEFEYCPDSTTVSTPIHEVLENRRGVCQDFAHLMIGCLRSLGLPARYVSGYLRTLPPPGKPRLVGADASHAWVAVFLPGEGWFDFDPTNNSTPDGSHVTLGWGRDYNDVSPLRGVILGGGTQTISVSVDVAEPHEVSDQEQTPR